MSRIQGKTVSDGTAVYAGVDVSKATLELHVLGSPGVGGGSAALARRFANDAAGISGLLHCLAERGRGRPCRVVFEPTGRLHHDLWRGLHEAGHAAVPFNPYRARHFAEADAALAKTDAIDARVLARAGVSMGLAVQAPPSEEQLRIKELHGLRLGITDAIRAAKNRLSGASDGLARHLLGQQIAFLEAQREEADAELARRIAADQQLARRRDILVSIPGIGPASVAAIIAELPELGPTDPKKLAALVGVAPFDRASGQWQGQSRTRRGRKRLRAALHMAAVSAARCNPDLSAFYRRLRTRNDPLPAKKALTAVLRKLLILANTLVREDRLWSPTRP